MLPGAVVPAPEGVCLWDVRIEGQHAAELCGQRAATKVRHLGSLDGHHRRVRAVKLLCLAPPQCEGDDAARAVHQGDLALGELGGRRFTIVHGLNCCSSGYLSIGSLGDDGGHFRSMLAHSNHIWWQRVSSVVLRTHVQPPPPPPPPLHSPTKLLGSSLSRSAMALKLYCSVGRSGAASIHCRGGRGTVGVATRLTATQAYTQQAEGLLIKKIQDSFGFKKGLNFVPVFPSVLPAQLPSPQ